MELRDYSDLRAPAGGRVRIPLNGEVYYANPDPPAETTLAASGKIPDGLADALSGINVKDPDAMKALEESNPVLLMRLAQAGQSSTERAIKFLQDVLEPESARRWAANMRPRPATPPPPEGVDPEKWEQTWQPTAGEQEAHNRRLITLRQCVAVYQELIGHYSGRPTAPPSSSENGHGGTGGTSTAGVPAGA